MGSWYLNPEEEIEIDILIKRCKGVCEIGRVLHRVYGVYLEQKEIIKQTDERSWKNVNKLDDQD